VTLVRTATPAGGSRRPLRWPLQVHAGASKTADLAEEGVNSLREPTLKCASLTLSGIEGHVSRDMFVETRMSAAAV